MCKKVRKFSQNQPQSAKILHKILRHRRVLCPITIGWGHPTAIRRRRRRYKGISPRGPPSFYLGEILPESPPPPLPSRDEDWFSVFFPCIPLGTSDRKRRRRRGYKAEEASRSIGRRRRRNGVIHLWAFIENGGKREKKELPLTRLFSTNLRLSLLLN